MKPTERASESNGNAPAQESAYRSSPEIMAELQMLHNQVAQFSRRIDDLDHSGEQVDKGSQMLLSHHYRDLASRGVLVSFQDVGFRNYTQWEEDGILHYIFSLIGTKTRRSVEICAGIGSESISANLILNHGWYSLLVDGNANNVNRGIEFFSKHPSTKFSGPKFLHHWIDRETVNTIVQEAGFSGEVDLLALDLDGIDYWIWEALTAVSPRVVVAEVMAHLGERSITVPYKPDFKVHWIRLDEDTSKTEGDGQRKCPIYNFALYGGASLPAFVKLAKSKGYRLIGANGIGCNAFFMRNDVGVDYFPEVEWSSCINPHYDVEGRKRIQDVLSHYEWVEV